MHGFHSDIKSVTQEQFEIVIENIKLKRFFIFYMELYM